MDCGSLKTTEKWSASLGVGSAGICGFWHNYSFHPARQGSGIGNELIKRTWEPAKTKGRPTRP